MIPAAKPINQKPVIRALEGEAQTTAPFWLMRQAGRYLPEYRALREKAGSFMNLCFNPEMAAEVTLQPLRRFDMDAAILFSDILVVPYALGQDLTFVEGEGPKLGEFALDQLKFGSFDKTLAPVYETLRILQKEMHPTKALLGFAGAPFTLACYMLTGKGDATFAKACAAARGNTQEFQQLMSLLTEAVTKHLVSQIEAGADAVQLFDSWAGLLQGEDFDRWGAEPAKKIIDGVRKACPHAPVIGFPRGAGNNYVSYARISGANAIGIDQSTTMDWAAQHLPDNICLQGNLDPEALLEGGKRLEKETIAILQAMEGRPFVFNLGHGVIKETPPEHVAQLRNIIRTFG